MRTKLWILGAALSLLAATPANALKVYKVTSEGLADVKVYVADSKGRADCIIHVETSAGLANGNARWYYENSEGLADVKMYFTDSEGLADKKVYFTTSTGLARCDVEWKNYKKERPGSAPRARRAGTQRGRGGPCAARCSGTPGYDKPLEDAFRESQLSVRRAYLHFHLLVRTDARKTLSMTPTPNNSDHLVFRDAVFLISNGRH